MSATFSVLLLTAAPPGHGVEAGGAFAKVDGRESLLRAIELFLNRDSVKQIQIAFLPDVAEQAKQRHGAHLSFSGVKVLTGGPKWMDQIAAAKSTIKPDVSHVIVHDAARPAVPYTDIDALFEAAERSQRSAVVLTSPVRAPLIEVDATGHALEYRQSKNFVHLLTPQALPLKRFMEMAESQTEVPAYELEMLKGSPLNRRLGGPGDAVLVRAMIQMLPKPKVRAASPFEEAQW